MIIAQNPAKKKSNIKLVLNKLPGFQRIRDVLVCHELVDGANLSLE